MPSFILGNGEWRWHFPKVYARSRPKAWSSTLKPPWWDSPSSSFQNCTSPKIQRILTNIRKFLILREEKFVRCGKLAVLKIECCLGCMRSSPGKTVTTSASLGKGILYVGTEGKKLNKKFFQGNIGRKPSLTKQNFMKKHRHKRNVTSHHFFRLL